MPDLSEIPDGFHRGDHLGARQLNQIVQAVIRQISGGGAAGVNFYGNRQVVNSNFRTHQPVFSEYGRDFVVREEREDYLICSAFYQPSGAGDQWVTQLYDKDLGISLAAVDSVAVAKPYILRREPWDNRIINIGGVNYEYNYGTRPDPGTRSIFPVSNPLSVVEEAISPAYFPGDIITAIRMVSGLKYKEQGNNPIGLVDVNTAGRRWETGVTSVCPMFAGASICQTVDIADGTVQAVPYNQRTVIDFSSWALSDIEGPADTMGFWSVTHPERLTAQFDGYYSMSIRLPLSAFGNHPTALPMYVWLWLQHVYQGVPIGIPQPIQGYVCSPLLAYSPITLEARTDLYPLRAGSYIWAEVYQIVSELNDVFISETDDITGAVMTMVMLAPLTAIQGPTGLRIKKGSICKDNPTDCCPPQ